MRGKTLERAAIKFCSALNRDVAAPQGDTRVGQSNILDSHHPIVSASYPTDQVNESRTGGYLGQSKNPNTIWDSEALHRLAGNKPENQLDQFGDEQIARSMEANRAYRDQLKNEPWKEAQEKLSDPNMLHEKIIPSNTGNEVGSNPKNPENAMSIFSDNRDFENIPKRTAGEMIKEQADERSAKSSEAKGEWNQLKSVTKADNTAILNQIDQQRVPQNSVHRAAVDNIFEGLINLIDKK